MLDARNEVILRCWKKGTFINDVAEKSPFLSPSIYFVVHAFTARVLTSLLHFIKPKTCWKTENWGSEGVSQKSKFVMYFYVRRGRSLKLVIKMIRQLSQSKHSYDRNHFCFHFCAWLNMGMGSKTTDFADVTRMSWRKISKKNGSTSQRFKAEKRWKRLGRTLIQNGF